MKTKIPSWKTLVNNELKRLYEGKPVKLWFAQYGPKTNYSTYYKYQCNTTKEEFDDPENWYHWVNLEERVVIIKSIILYSPQTKFLKITFDPIIYQGNEIKEISFSNKILEFV